MLSDDLRWACTTNLLPCCPRASQVLLFGIHHSPHTPAAVATACARPADDRLRSAAIRRTSDGQGEGEETQERSAIHNLFGNVLTALRSITVALCSVADALSMVPAGLTSVSAAPNSLRTRWTIFTDSSHTVAGCVLVWEAAYAGSSDSALGGTQAGVSRLYIAAAARPTLLLVVATLR